MSLEADALAVAAPELLKMMLATSTRGAPSIRVIFLTREAIRNVLLNHPVSAASIRAQLDVVVAAACDRAVPIVKFIVAALGEIVDPNLDTLRTAISSILRDGSEQAVRTLCAHASATGARRMMLPLPLSAVCASYCGGGRTPAAMQ